MRTILNLALALPLFLSVASCGGGEEFSGNEGGQGGSAGNSTAGSSGNAGQGGSSAGNGGASGGGSGGSSGGASGQGGSAGQSGSAGVAGSAGASGSAGNAGAAGAPACDPAAEPDETGALFVSVTTGSDETGDGSVKKPYKSLSKALQEASTQKKGRVVLAEGEYTGALTLPDPDAGLTLEGGWALQGNTWVRNCKEIARTKTVIRSEEENKPVLTIDAPKHSVILRTLSIKTKDQGISKPDSPGESLIGLLVKGDGAKVTLEDVEVTSGNAGDGGQASPAKDGEVAACDGVTDCQDGSNGENGPDGDPAKTSGSFGPDGYTPADGQPGKEGTPGKNGTLGGEGETFICFTCKGTTKTTCGNGGFSPLEAPSKPGTCGCHGGAGGGGSFGKGGGASVGLLVSGNASVSVKTSRVASSLGGKGSTGSSGGLGVDGSEGAKGEDGLLCSIDESGKKCVWNDANSTCKPFSSEGAASGGSAGGKGGKGGNGGKGGGGSGGPSFAIMKVGGASVQVELDSTLAHGEPGQGADGAAPGQNGDIGELLAEPRRLWQAVPLLPPLRLRLALALLLLVSRVLVFEPLGARL